LRQGIINLLHAGIFKCDAIVFEHDQNLIQRNGPIAIQVSLFEYIGGLSVSDIRVGHLQKLIVVFKGELVFVILVAVFIKVCFQLYSVEMKIIS